MRFAGFLCLVPLMSSAQVIYRSPQFTVAGDRVTQAQFEARAISAAELESNYPKGQTKPGNPPVTWRWKLSSDIGSYPKLRSNFPLIDALYNLSLEELKMDIRPDGAFMAGEKWDGVWTRDISYSILLSLAAIEPEVAKTSLLRKVARGRIIQDTGTGGSWPCSTDRMTWALAAWEVYLSTGDRDWLAQAFEIIRASAADDAHVIFSKDTGMALGESSFLDWREQTYPRWMQPADIYSSQALGTNAVHYRAYRILTLMAGLLGKPSGEYEKTANRIRDGVNQNLWVEDRGYYGQYLYGRDHMSLSPRPEALGEALAILFDLAPADRQQKMLASVPVMPFGIPCIYPQIPNIPPYHNDAIWPFVQAYWNLAAAKHADGEALLHGMSAIWRAAALFLTNQENMVADTGSAQGTEINSPRQLWSVAGNLAMIYRVLFGMEFTPGGLRFHPVIPKPLAGSYDLANFHYRAATLNIHVEGYGEIAAVALDGHPLASPQIAPDLAGTHELRITMANEDLRATPLRLEPDAIGTETPQPALTVAVTGNVEGSIAAGISWPEIPDARYSIFRNGSYLSTADKPEFATHFLRREPTAEYQVSAQSNHPTSFLSEPMAFRSALTINASPNGPLDVTRTDNRTVTLHANIPIAGTYSIDFEYANGSGPINTDNKCAIRTLSVDGHELGAIVFPQRGTESWKNFGYSSRQRTHLTEGDHTFLLTFDPWDENMNGEVNRALIAHMRFTRIE